MLWGGLLLRLISLEAVSFLVCPLVTGGIALLAGHCGICLILFVARTQVSTWVLAGQACKRKVAGNCGKDTIAVQNLTGVYKILPHHHLVSEGHKYEEVHIVRYPYPVYDYIPYILLPAGRVLVSQFNHGRMRWSCLPFPERRMQQEYSST